MCSCCPLWLPVRPATAESWYWRVRGKGEGCRVGATVSIPTLLSHYWERVSEGGTARWVPACLPNTVVGLWSNRILKEVRLDKWNRLYNTRRVARGNTFPVATRSLQGIFNNGRPSLARRMPEGCDVQPLYKTTLNLVNEMAHGGQKKEDPTITKH